MNINRYRNVYRYTGFYFEVGHRHFFKINYGSNKIVKIKFSKGLKLLKE